MKIIIKSFGGNVLPFSSQSEIPSETDKENVVELSYYFRLSKFNADLHQLEWASKFDKFSIKAKALNAYRNSNDGYERFEEDLKIGIDVTDYVSVETINEGKSKIVRFKPTDKAVVKEKPFIEAAVKDLLNDWHKEEITFSRMVEKMNEVAIEWSNKK